MSEEKSFAGNESRAIIALQGAVRKLNLPEQEAELLYAILAEGLPAWVKHTYQRELHNRNCHG